MVKETVKLENEIDLIPSSPMTEKQKRGIVYVNGENKGFYHLYKMKLSNGTSGVHARIDILNMQEWLPDYSSARKWILDQFTYHWGK